MHARHALVATALLGACAGQGTAPAPALPPGGSNGEVKPPVTTVNVPDTGGGAPQRFETVQLNCPVKNPTAACANETGADMTVVVDRFKDCTISSYSKELTMQLVNGGNGNNVTVAIAGYAGTRRYQLSSGVTLTGVRNGTNSAEVVRIGTGQCTGACEAQVTDSAPAGPGAHPVTIKVACPSLCPDNSCKVCTETGSSGTAGVEFSYSGTCQSN